ASLNSIEQGKGFQVTPRMIGYSVVLTVLATILAVLVFTRSDVQSTLLRAPGALFQKSPEGKISNLYTLKLVNKSSRDVPVELKLLNVPGNVKLMGGGQELVVPKEQLAQTSVLIELDGSVLAKGTASIRVGIFSRQKRLETVETVFIGPRAAGH